MTTQKTCKEEKRVHLLPNSNIPLDAFEPGDFVKHRTLGPFETGLVIGPTEIFMFKGKEPIRGYKIRKSNGREDFITEDDIELIAPHEEHWKRLLLEAFKKAKSS